jgi:hypothetical protein
MSARHTCATCAHYGECADLHHCGGSAWVEAEDEDGEGYDPREDGPDPYDQWLERSADWQARN